MAWREFKKKNEKKWKTILFVRSLFSVDCIVKNTH